MLSTFPGFDTLFDKFWKLIWKVNAQNDYVQEKKKVELKERAF